MLGVGLAGLFVQHLLDIAVVGGNQGLAANFFQCLGNPFQAAVQTFRRFLGGFKAARVADHVAVGVVHHEQVVLAALDGFDQLVGYFRCTHFRLQIIGGHLGGGHQDPVFAGVGLFAAATEEESDVGVFFRFGNSQLGLALAGQVLPQAVLQ